MESAKYFGAEEALSLGLADAIAFTLANGLSWPLGGETGRTRTEADLTPWRAARGAAGRMPPIGFPRSNRFS